MLARVLGSTSYGYFVWRELLAAAAAHEAGDPKPLLRLAAADRRAPRPRRRCTTRAFRRSGACTVARRFPRSTFVELRNSVHVTALGDLDTCASQIYARFVRTLRAGDVSCARRIPELRLVPAFARTLDEVGATRPRPFELERVVFVPGVAVSGTVTWHRGGAVAATPKVSAPRGVAALLDLDLTLARPLARASLTGWVGGERLAAGMLAPGRGEAERRVVRYALRSAARPIQTVRVR